MMSRHELPARIAADPATSTATNLTGSSQVISNAPCSLRGLSIAETGGSTAKIRLWDSATATSSGKKLLGSYTLVSGESREEGNTRPALLGVWVEVVSGTVEGVVYTGA